MDPRGWGEVILHARVIVALIPLALRGLKSRAVGGRKLLQRRLVEMTASGAGPA